MRHEISTQPSGFTPDAASFLQFVASLGDRTAQLALIDKSGFNRIIRTKMRWEIEEVLVIKIVDGRAFEYRGDGHMNMVFDRIVYTTEPPENPREAYYGEQDIWQPVLTPDGDAKNFRVRGLI